MVPVGVALLDAETVDGAIAGVYHAKLFASLSEGQVNRNATLAKKAPSQNLSLPYCRRKKQMTRLTMFRKKKKEMMVLKINTLEYVIPNQARQQS